MNNIGLRAKLGNPEGVRVTFARDTKLFILFIFSLFSHHYLTQKSDLRSKIETRKQVHAVFLFTVVQRRSRHNVTVILSYGRASWFILTSRNAQVISCESMYSLKYEQHFLPIVINSFLFFFSINAPRM